MGHLIIIIFCMLNIDLSSASDTSEPIICAFSNASSALFISAKHEKQLMSNSKGQLFERSCQYCFTLWEPREPSLILAQGCWSSDFDQCNNENCVSTTSSPDSSRVTDKFCCCRGNDCNRNFSLRARSSSIPSTYLNNDKTTYSILLVISISASICLCILVLGIALFLTRKYNAKYKKNLKEFNLPFIEIESTKGLLTQCNDLSDLSIGSQSKIVRGAFGAALVPGTLHGENVTLKIYSNTNHFNKERNLYELLNVYHHPSLCFYYGSRSNVFLNKSVLVFSSIEKGPLHIFLQESTLNWTQFIFMLSTINNGVSFLHSSEIDGLHEVKKPSICHRNLSSQNIGVRSDYSCVLFNFEFSVWSRSRSNIESLASSDSHVFRYLAPEYLEESINLKECESSYKQGDIYSLGLLFWEMSKRCSDLYQGSSKAPKFEYAFESEIGLRPSFEEMRDLVSRHKVRPSFPKNWQNSNPAIQSLRETIEDSWDYDGEARLTAFTIQERLNELKGLWKQYQRNHKLKNSFTESSIFHTNEISKAHLENEPCNIKAWEPNSKSPNSNCIIDISLNVPSID